jgi:hypothetical protein
MEDLKKEIATLKNGIEALNGVIVSYTGVAEILSLKLEEAQQAIEQPKVDLACIFEAVEKWFEQNLPNTTDLNWSDGGFSANFELELEDVLNEELPYRWKTDLSEYIINAIQDSNK